MQVDVNAAHPVFFRELAERRDVQQACIVDERIEAAECPHSCFDQFACHAQIADVAVERDGAAAGSRDLVDHDLRPAQIVDEH